MPIKSLSYSLILFLFCALIVGVTGCVLRSVKTHKNIVYAVPDQIQNVSQQELTVYMPLKTNAPADVLVFIHGGNWNSGSKGQYRFLGAQFARGIN